MRRRRSQRPDGVLTARPDAPLVAATLLFALAAPVAPAATQGQPPSVADFFGNPQIADEQISPDGRTVAVLGQDSSGRMRLTIVDPAAPATAGTRIAPPEDVDIASVHWISDNRLVFDVIDLTGEQSTGNGGLFAVNRDGSEFVALIAPSFRFHQDVTGRMHSRELPTVYTFFSATHDGSADVIVAENLFPNTDPFNARAVVLHRLNTFSREIRTLTFGQPPGVTEWTLDTQDAPRLATAYVGARRIVYLRGAGAKAWSVVGEYDRYRSDDFTPAFFGFDGTLYAQHGASGSLFRFDAAQDRFEGEPVLQRAGFELAVDPVLDFKARRLLGYQYRLDAVRTTWLDARMAQYQKEIDAALPETINTITCGNCLSSPFLLIRSTSDRQPTRYLAFETATARLVELGAERPRIGLSQMGRREFVRYTARDGLAIPAYVTRPPRTQEPSPLVVLVHGGPYVRGPSWEWDPQAQFLASRGYAVIQPDYRGSKGFGLDFFKAGWHQWGLAMQSDLADAARWAVAQGIADSKRIAIAGGSYGGYASLMGLIRDPDLFRCAIDWFGVTDLDLMYTLSWSDASDADLRYGQPALIGDPVTDAQRLHAASPLRQADRITQPVLLAYSSQDRRVPITHGERLRAAIATPRNEVEWVVYKGEGHGLIRQDHRIDFWTRVERFLNRYLGSERPDPHPRPSPANGREE